MEVIQLPGLVQVDGLGLRSVKECRQNDGLVHLQFGVQVNTVAIPHGGLQPAEGLTSFGDPVKVVVVREEPVMDCSRRHARWGLHRPTVVKVPISSVYDADHRVLIMEGVHQHSREYETEQGGGQYAALFHSVGHCECFGYRPRVSDAGHHSVVKLTHHYKLQKASVISNLTTILEEARVDTSPNNATFKARLEDAIAATLCNLSAHENFRNEIMKNTIPVLMNAIILPLSGLPQQRKENEVFSDEPSTDFASEEMALVFATATLRNVLTETADCRHRLRETPGLVAALIYLCKCIAHAGEFDSRVLENCACALRNLSFALQEVRDPAYLTRREAGFYDAATRLPEGKRLNFHRKPKSGLILDTTKDATDQRLEDQPSYLEIPPSALSLFHGSQLLWQPDIVLVYLSVLRGSKNPCTVEAVTGAIQNLTACDWRPSIDIRRRFREERGIPVLIELLHSEEDCVVKTAVTALRNLAVDERNRDEIALHGIPAMIARLPVLQNSTTPVAAGAATPSVTLNTAASILATLFALIKDNVEHATFFVDCGGVPPCMAIANTGQYTDPLAPVPTQRDKTVNFARHILRLLWHNPELQKRFQTAGWRAANFCVLEKCAISCGPSAAAAKAVETLRPSQVTAGQPESQPERGRPLSTVISKILAKVCRVKHLRLVPIKTHVSSVLKTSTEIAGMRVREVCEKYEPKSLNAFTVRLTLIARFQHSH
ncbi:unnamed protein product [Schistocephalus solidus]|uniref:Armadillo/beta-catenin-like repeat protein n=1 Tax=Schistocephalus solidus TaxID=70667 RepID=A0A183SX75_SCHSO|nr:unnamed protein product [Schistocephalus solidus]